jgi:hypothetical protein
VYKQISYEEALALHLLGLEVWRYIGNNYLTIPEDMLKYYFADDIFYVREDDVQTDNV